MLELNTIYQILKESQFMICTDSRSISDGAVFFALKGEKFNGNQFADEVLERGASYAVIDESFSDLYSDKKLVCRDVLATLQDLARLHRMTMKQCFVIGITGSNGKTTCKELLFSVLKNKDTCICTKGNLNNHIGVPLTIFQIQEDTKMAIIEMGANHPGEIDFLCSIADPDWAWITSIGKAHLEGFGSIEGVLKTKLELFQFVKAKKGRCFYNLDNDYLVSVYNNNELNNVEYSVSYFEKTFALRDLKTDPSIHFILDHQNSKIEIDSDLYGMHNLHNILGVTRIAREFDVDWQTIQTGIKNYIPKNQRSEIVHWKSNTVYLDAYNANPSSMSMAIESFSKVTHPHKWIILGEMAELGQYSISEHEQLVAKAVGLNPEVLLLIGKNFSEVKSKGPTKFGSMEECKVYLNALNPKDKMILIKGSRSNQLEKLIQD